MHKLICDSGRISYLRFSLGLLSASADLGARRQFIDLICQKALIGSSVSLNQALSAHGTFILPLLSPSLYAPSSASYSRILVTSKCIRWSRTTVPVTMGSSICSSSTRTKQWGNSENVLSTRSNKSVERFLDFPRDLYRGPSLLVQRTL